MELSGYVQHKQVMAQRYHKGRDRWIYLISLPLHLIPSHLPIPDPEQPFPGNRRVSVRHAEGFGQYWRDNPGQWATPPLLLDTVYPLKQGFEPIYEVSGVEFGTLDLPHNSAAELDILDGQHRILGWKRAIDQLAAEMKDARMQLQSSRQHEDEVGMQTYQKKIDELTLVQERLSSEFVTLEILEGITVEEHKQVFSDIANNAKGITKSVTVSFDRRSVLNRVAMDLAENHQLLADRVDMEKDRIVGGNENYVSGRNLVDIVRHVVVGIDGRMTARREADMKESSIADMAEQYLRALVDSFPVLQQLEDGEIMPADLREKSLLGSTTMLRVLAGAYHILAVDISDERHAHVTSAGDTTARELFSSLSDQMNYPISDIWFGTGLFPTRDAKAPSSRAQDLKELTRTIARWGQDGLPFKA